MDEPVFTPAVGKEDIYTEACLNLNNRGLFI